MLDFGSFIHYPSLFLALLGEMHYLCSLQENERNMKNALYLLKAILQLTTGCNRPTQTTLCNELLRAEELMYPAPDSALHILQGMTPPADELNRATWALLLTQAKYKCFVDQSDSLVNIAHDYFMKGSNPQRKALVLFCKGALYDEKEMMEHALTYYASACQSNIR